MICGRRPLRSKSACTRGAAPAGRVDGRAATACSCGAESPSPVFVVARVRVSSRERESDVRRVCAFLLSLRLCKKGRVCLRTTQTWWLLLLLLRDRPRLRPWGPGHSSPLQVVSVKAAISVVFQGSSTVPQRLSPPQPSRSTSRTVVSLDRGSRVLGFGL